MSEMPNLQVVKSVPVPWEFRINKLKTPLVLMKGDYKERYNYWFVNENNELEIGYHGKDSTSSKVVGMVTKLRAGEYFLEVDKSLDVNFQRKILEPVLQQIADSGTIMRRMSSGAQRMAA